jgi:hypothetical protein
LSDEQLERVFRAARPLQVRDRDALLQMSAERTAPSPAMAKCFASSPKCSASFYRSRDTAPRWGRRGGGIRESTDP